MTLLQVKIEESLKKAIQRRASRYNIPVSSLIKIVLVRTFLDESEADEKITPGNVFNAERDNKGKGIPLEKLLALL